MWSELFWSLPESFQTFQSSSFGIVPGNLFFFFLLETFLKYTTPFPVWKQVPTGPAALAVPPRAPPVPAMHRPPKPPAPAGPVGCMHLRTEALPGAPGLLSFGTPCSTIPSVPLIPLLPLPPPRLTADGPSRRWFSAGLAIDGCQPGRHTSYGTSRSP